MSLPVGTSDDSLSYFTAFRSMILGSVDATRTPLYPAFVGVINVLGGGLRAIALVQCLVFNISVYFFYRAALGLTGNALVSAAASLFYVLSPQTAQWSTMVLTESLSVSLMVFWLYLAVRLASQRLSLPLALAFSLCMTLMLALRPAFAFVLVGAAVLAFSLWRHRGKWVAIGVATVIPGLALLAYSWAFYQSYGVFTPSRVGDINAAVNLQLNHDNINTDCISDSAERACWDHYLHSGVSPYDGYTAIQDEYGIEHMHRTLSQIMAHNRSAVIKHSFVRFTWFTEAPVSPRYQPVTPLNNILRLLCIDGRAISVLTLLYMVFVIWLYRRGGHCVMPLTLIALLLSGIGISVVGAQNDYVRLCTSLVPVLALAYAQIASYLRIQYHE